MFPQLNYLIALYGAHQNNQWILIAFTYATQNEEPLTFKLLDAQGESYLYANIMTQKLVSSFTYDAATGRWVPLRYTQRAQGGITQQNQ